MVRYLHHADHNPRINLKNWKLFGDELDFEDVPMKDIHKIKKKIELHRHFSVFLYKNNVKYPIYVSKNALKKIMLIYY